MEAFTHTHTHKETNAQQKQVSFLLQLKGNGSGLVRGRVNEITESEKKINVNTVSLKRNRFLQ